jgi:hypothetical protein
MFEYKSEVFISPNAAGVIKVLSEKEMAVLDGLINKRAAEGWELVTHSVSGTSQFVITFKKEK